MDNFTVRVKLSEAGGYNSIETGWAYLAAIGNHARDSRPAVTRLDTQGPMVPTRPT